MCSAQCAKVCDDGKELIVRFCPFTVRTMCIILIHISMPLWEIGPYALCIGQHVDFMVEHPIRETFIYSSLDFNLAGVASTCEQTLCSN